MPAAHASWTPPTVRRWLHEEATDRRTVWRCNPVPTVHPGVKNRRGCRSDSLPASKQRGSAEHLSPGVSGGDVAGRRAQEGVKSVATGWRKPHSRPSSPPPAGKTAALSREVRGAGRKAKPRKGRPLRPRPASAAASRICPSRRACLASGLRVLLLAAPPAPRSVPPSPRVSVASRRGARWVPGARGSPRLLGFLGRVFETQTPPPPPTLALLSRAARGHWEAAAPAPCLCVPFPLPSLQPPGKQRGFL